MMSKRLQTTAAVTCMKLSLLVFDVVFCISGIILLAIGIWMKISLHHFLDLSEDYNEIAPYLLIGTGAVIIVVGFAAFWCTTKGHPLPLYILSGFLFLVFILELAAAVLFGYKYRTKLQDGFLKGLNNTLYHYGEAKLRDEDLNLMQAALGCCGVNNYQDWFGVPWAKGLEIVPKSCCIKETNCDRGPPIQLEDIYQEGCYNKIVDFTSHNLAIICGGVVGFACMQLLGILLSYYLAKYISKARYEEVV